MEYSGTHSNGNGTNLRPLQMKQLVQVDQVLVKRLQQRVGARRATALAEFRSQGKPLEGLMTTATLSHPLGQLPARAVHFAPAADGRLISRETVPAGRWRLDLSVRHGAEEARYRIDLQ